MAKEITLKEHARSIAALGGKASMKKRTQAQRKKFAKLGGKVGGKARAQVLSADERKKIARVAAEARWDRYRAEHPEKAKPAAKKKASKPAL